MVRAWMLHRQEHLWMNPSRPATGNLGTQGCALDPAAGVILPTPRCLEALAEDRDPSSGPARSLPHHPRLHRLHTCSTGTTLLMTSRHVGISRVTVRCQVP